MESWDPEEIEARLHMQVAMALNSSQTTENNEEIGETSGIQYAEDIEVVEISDDEPNDDDSVVFLPQVIQNYTVDSSDEDDDVVCTMPSPNEHPYCPNATVEEGSNDFIDKESSSRRNFNLDLHEPDLRGVQGNAATTSSRLPDLIYESESTSSTMGTPSKAVPFTEADLDPSNLFLEPDLASFRDLITPDPNPASKKHALAKPGIVTVGVPLEDAKVANKKRKTPESQSTVTKKALNKNNCDPSNSDLVLNRLRGKDTGKGSSWVKTTPENRSPRKVFAYMTFADYWSENMEDFYNKKWENDMFDVNEVLKNLPGDRSKWRILDEDLCPSLLKRKDKTRRPSHCSLCSSGSHLEVRCPNKICTTCGTKSNYFTSSCSKCTRYCHLNCCLCGFRGHSSDNCPDLWRRYHLTTTAGPLVKSNNQDLKPRQKQWCSACARRGHLQVECSTLGYFATTPAVISYANVYADIYSGLQFPLETVTRLQQEPPKMAGDCPKAPEKNVEREIKNAGKESHILEEKIPKKPDSKKAAKDSQKQGNNIEKPTMSQGAEKDNSKLKSQEGNLLKLLSKADNECAELVGHLEKIIQTPPAETISIVNVDSYYAAKLQKHPILSKMIFKTTNIEVEVEVNHQLSKSLARFKYSGISPKGFLEIFKAWEAATVLPSQPQRALRHFLKLLKSCDKAKNLYHMHAQITKQLQAINDKPGKVTKKELTNLRNSYRTLNMRMFGILQLGNGKQHMEMLKRLSCCTRSINKKEHRQMIEAFRYIFTYDPHDDYLQQIQTYETYEKCCKLIVHLNYQKSKNDDKIKAYQKELTYETASKLQPVLEKMNKEVC